MRKEIEDFRLIVKNNSVINTDEQRSEQAKITKTIVEAQASVKKLQPEHDESFRKAAAQALIKVNILKDCIEHLTALTQAFCCQLVAPDIKAAVAGMIQVMLQILDIIFPKSESGPDAESLPTLVSQYSQKASARSCQDLIKLLLKFLGDPIFLKVMEKKRYKDTIIWIIVESLHLNMSSTCVMTRHHNAETCRLFRTFHDWVADETKKFCGEQPHVARRQNVSSTDVDEKVEGCQETLIKAHVKLLTLLGAHDELLSDVSALISNGNAPYVKGLFWSLAVLQKHEHKNMAADLLATLGVLCMASANESALRPKDVFSDEGLPSTHELWKMLANHSVNAGPASSDDRAIAIVIVLSIVIVSKGIATYELHINNWTAEMWKELHQQAPKMLEWLLSHSSRYTEQPWLQYIFSSLAIRLLFGFYLSTHVESLGSGFSFERVLEASLALLSNESLLFKCMGATLYMIFHSSCQSFFVRNSKQPKSTKGGVKSIEHVRILHQALETIRDVCTNPPLKLLNGEWIMTRDKFIKVHLGISDNGPSWVAWAFCHAAVDKFSALINGVTHFVATYSPFDSDPIVKRAELLNRENLLQSLTE